MTAATYSREMLFERAGATDAGIPCTIASTTPVLRDGIGEILDCTAAGVDLSRAPLPLIVSHDSNRLPIGVIEDLKAIGTRVTGMARFGTSPEAIQVREDVIGGTLRSLSVGYRLTDAGTPVEGGIKYRWQPHEASIVSIPADPKSGFYRSLPQSNTMTTIDTTRDEITALTKRHNLPELGATLIRDGATIEQANRAVLDELATRDRASGGHLNVSPTRHDGGQREADLIVETLVQRMGGKVKGETIRNADLTGLAVRSLEMAGQRIGHGETRDRIFERALSTRMQTVSDFSSLLGTAVGRVLHEAYANAPSALKAIARQNNAADFRTRTVARLGNAPSLEKVNEGGEFHYGAVADFGNTWALATYGRIISLSRQAMVNDDLDAFAQLLRKFGEASARREADELAGILVTPGLVDGAALFDAGRSSLITSAGLSVVNLGAAVAALRQQTEDGELVTQSPGAIIVPSALEQVALTLMAQYRPAAAADVNPFPLQVIVEPRLDASSTTTWYLAAASQSSLEYGYLDGAEGPQTTQREGFEVDGVELKCRLDFGCGWVAPVGWVKATA